MASSPLAALHCRIYSFLLSLFLFFSFHAGSSGQMVPAMYVFGDSLVDVGNNHHLPLSLLKADFPHNGVDYPGRKATGRFSNGKNTADFLAEKLGLQTPPPYLSLPSVSNVVDVFLKGVSFASGGAGVLSTTNKGQCLALDKQIEFFSKVYGAFVQQLGSVETQKHLSQSIFAIVIGSNDLLQYFRSDAYERSTPPPQQFVDSLASTLKGQLMRIYNLGARKIVLVGTGPIGCCPSRRLQNKTGDCNVESNHGSIKYNEAVNSLLQGMKSELGDMTYSFFDTYTVVMEYIQKPATYGFADVKTACCGLGNLHAKIGCLPISSYCSNRRDHLFWDFYHPTEATSGLLTDSLFDGSPPYVYPVNGRQLAAL
uniref:GDSL esterase/lipase At5g55050 n=1 Tax=Anthurium amnicola TaxID=1678845 RepID=A0A1D1ZGL7_9ARAE